MQRRRAAILFADVVGYSRLMERDEDGTHRTLCAYLDIWSDSIGAHGGRIVNCAGDALLAEMPNAAQALRCAVEAHNVIKTRNRDVPVDRRLRFRAGINIGNVIVDRDDIYGDGVNVAARLAGRADAGGICISETDFNELEPPPDLGFEYLGELQVRNIAKPIGAFRILLRPEDAGKFVGHPRSPARRSPWMAAALASMAIVAITAGLILSQRPTALELGPAAGRVAISLMAKPSIAIPQFENLTGDPEQDHLAASISDGIFTALSKFPNLSVSAPRETGGRRVAITESAGESAIDLDVQYILRGTVRRTADRVRITTRLFDADRRRYVWGGRYDTALQDVFASEDGVIENIATGLWAELTQSVETAAWRNEADSAEAYRLAVIGLEHYRRFTPADNAEAKYLFRTAVTLDPDFLSAWAGLGWSYFNEAQYGWGDNPTSSLERASTLAARVLEMDKSHQEARALEAAIQRNRKHTGAVIY